MNEVNTKKIFRFLTCMVTVAISFISHLTNAQIGYYDAPYTRYEADKGTLTNATATSPTFDQWSLQSEASEQVCVDMTGSGASVQWTVTAAGNGLVVRYSVPDGQSGVVEVFANGVSMGNLNLSSYYSWESLWNNGNPNNAGVTNQAPKMRFDEVRMKMASSVPVGGTLKLVRVSGNVYIDFAELEPIPAQVTASGGDVTYDGSGLQNFINNHGGQTIYLPAGTYNVGTTLYFGNANTTLKGAGMWYTEIHFTSGTANNGGLWGQASNISYSGLYLTTDRNSRSSSYKAINGVYTSGSTITNVWAEHFECGAWIGQYGTGPSVADGFTMSYCRFRNNYADGTNLCKGTKNAIVEHCSYRNNGDDDMAIWSANGQECQNNIFRYNTSENTWRSAGLAIYGGYNNKGYNLLIQDNVEVGIKVNNAFGGAPFNTGGMHEIYNIWIKRCGTNYDLFNSRVGAIDLGAYNRGAGTWVRNVKFSCITITDSKNDAIYIQKVDGDGFANLVFENITIDGTGKEYPDNGGTGSTRGYGLLFENSPGGDATYCGMTYANRGGNAPSNTGTAEQGPFSWTAAGSCPSGCTAFTSSSTTLTSATTFGVCNNPIALTATSSAPSGNTVSYIEFFVDNVSVGTDNSSSYSVNWSNPTVGSHQVKAVSHYSGGSTSTSIIQNVTVSDGIYTTATAPTIDGTIDALWGGFNSFSLSNTTIGAGNISGSNDLSAYFKVARDATNLYILIDVTDANLTNDSPEAYKDDNIELYIDHGNDKATTFGSDDYAFQFSYNDNTAIAGVTYAQTVKSGPTGYIMEIRIPWSTIGGAPSTGSFLGFEVHVDDDDDGGDRDSKITWSETVTDVSYQNPSKWGTLQIAGCSNPLPVELITFIGEMIGEDVFLNWVTASEVNNDRFVIERSANGSDWMVIGTVEGAGTSSSVNEYNFSDSNAPQGINYYRLRQVDRDGSINYSSVVVVKGEDQFISVAPNPFNDAFTIKTDISGLKHIVICDLSGRSLYELIYQGENRLITIQPDIPAGAYILTIQSGESLQQWKLIKR